MKRALIVSVILILALLGGLYVRCIFEARKLIAEASFLWSQGEQAAAVEAYAGAVRWYAPFNSYAIEAGHALFAHAKELPERDALRFRALMLLRSALWSTRSFLATVPGSFHSEMMEPVDDALRHTLQAQAAATAREPGNGYAAEITRGVREHPAYWIHLLAQVALWGWIAGVLTCIWRGMTPEGRILQPVFRNWGVGAAALYLLWLAALMAE